MRECKAEIFSLSRTPCSERVRIHSSILRLDLPGEFPYLYWGESGQKEKMGQPSERNVQRYL